VDEGTTFGSYSLIELLGEGGMGQVYRAYDSVTDRIVALKVLPAHSAEDREFRERFRREAHAASRLSDPHVIPIHTYGEIDGRLFLDMRLIEGTDVHSLLVQRGPMAPHQAVSIVGQVAAALDSAHAAGLIHRDVKPSNILVTPRDFAYLIDFGIAHAAGDTSLTSIGSAIGTFAYMAPERFTNAEQDSRSDIYALACVLYECLTGTPPFARVNIEQQIAAHLSALPPQPSRTRPNLSVAFDDVIVRGMAKRPGDRYQGAGELASAAHQALVIPPFADNHSYPGPVYRYQTASRPSPPMHPPPLPTSPSPWGTAPRNAEVGQTQTAMPRRRRRRIIAAASVIVVVLAVVASWIIASRSHSGASASHTDTTSSALDQGTSTNNRPQSEAVYVTDVVEFNTAGPPDSASAARLTVDGNKTTLWQSDVYQTQFSANGPKNGIGLLATLENPTLLTYVWISTPVPGSNVQIRSAPTATPTFDQTTLLSSATLDENAEYIVVVSDTPVRYVLVWIDKLAKTDSHYQSTISDMGFLGTR
jgi:serine/threonine protein kinase